MPRSDMAAQACATTARVAMRLCSDMWQGCVSLFSANGLTAPFQSPQTSQNNLDYQNPVRKLGQIVLDGLFI